MNTQKIVDQIKNWNTVPHTAPLSDRAEANQQLSYLWRELNATNKDAADKLQKQLESQLSR